MFGNFGNLREKLLKKRLKSEADLSVETSNLTHNQISSALKALRILGLEGKCQQLTKHDCIEFLYAMGLNPTDDIIDSKLLAFKLHYQKTFTFGQLAHLWHSMLKDLTDEEEILKRAFQFFDKDGNGEISVQELRTTMRELGDLLSEEELNTFMHILDVNKDGAIGYNEFLATLKTQSSLVVEMQGGLSQEPPRQPQQQSRPNTSGATPVSSNTQPPNVLSSSEAAPVPLSGLSCTARNGSSDITVSNISTTDGGSNDVGGSVCACRLDAPQAPCLAPLAKNESQMRRSKDVLRMAAGTAAAGNLASGGTVGDGGNVGGLRTPSSLD